jgi:hypothetical protein
VPAGPPLQDSVPLFGHLDYFHWLNVNQFASIRKNVSGQAEEFDVFRRSTKQSLLLARAPSNAWIKILVYVTDLPSCLTCDTCDTRDTVLWTMNAYDTADGTSHAYVTLISDRSRSITLPKPLSKNNPPLP